MSADTDHMRRAIALAARQLGRTGENPAVGCIIVKDGAVIGEGATADGGRPHAEEIALVAAGSEARDATAFVTLEPCAQRSGGGLSCSQRLAEAGIARVVFAYDDLSVLAAGLGAERLRAAGVVVETGLLSDEAAPLYANYTPRR